MNHINFTITHSFTMPRFGTSHNIVFFYFQQFAEMNEYLLVKDTLVFNDNLKKIGRMFFSTVPYVNVSIKYVRFFVL